MGRETDELPVPRPDSLSVCFPPPISAQNLTTCEVCGACFETRKGLSSHARSHLRQLGVAESESSGAPIDLLYELMKQKGKPDGHPMVSPTLGKKSASPKDGIAGSPRPALLALGKGGERSLDGPINKAIKSPPGFSKSLSQPGSPILKKVPPVLSGSPSPKNPEEKSSKLSLSPLQSSPKAQWPQADEEGPLNLSESLSLSFFFFCQSCFPLSFGAGDERNPWVLLVRLQLCALWGELGVEEAVLMAIMAPGRSSRRGKSSLV